MTWASFLGVQGHLGVASGPFRDVFWSILAPKLAKSYQKKCGVVVCVIFSGESATFGHVFHVLKLGGTVILVKKPLFFLCIIDVPMVCCFLSLNVILVGKNVFFLQKRFTFDHFFDQNGIRKTSGVPLTTSGVTMGRLDDVSVTPEGRLCPPGVAQTFVKY